MPTAELPAPQESPFHAGEAAVQARLGVRDKMEAIGRKVMRSVMPDQHRAFFEQLPFIVVGATDAAGQPWASLLAGPPGFLHSPEPERLVLDIVPSTDDPVAAAWQTGGAVGLLGIELPTRRRNRVNGILTPHPGGAELRVTQSFGNCPKYIQTREASSVSAQPGLVTRAPSLSAADRHLIGQADTLFIASSSGGQGGAAGGTDVSHRGGKPGFVRIDDDDRTLTIPDFLGNWLFNTIGNLVLDPRAGLVFVDWNTGDLLHLAGEAEIMWDGPEVDAFEGALRLIRLRVQQVLRRPGAVPLRWSAPELSPFVLRTGSWTRP